MTHLSPQLTHAADTSSPEAVAERTYFWERIRAVFSGIIEIIWQPGAAVALLVAIRYYDAGTIGKSLISASGPIGFLLTPLTLSLFAHSRRPIHQCMSLLFVGTGAFFAAIPFLEGALPFIGLVTLAHILMVQYIPMYTEMYSSHFTTTQRGHRIATVFIITGAFSITANLITGEFLDRNLAYFKPLMGLVALCCFASAYCLSRIPSLALQRDQVGHPFRNISLAWRDKLFGWLLSSWMLMGFGNLMTLPLRTETARNHQTVQVPAFDLGQRVDVSPGDAGRLGQYISGRVHFLSLEVVHDMMLLNVRGQAQGLRTQFVEGDQHRYRLLNFRSVEYTAAG